MDLKKIFGIPDQNYMVKKVNFSFIANRAIFNFEFFNLSCDHLIQWSFGFMSGASSLAKLEGYSPCGRGDITL